MVDNFNDVLRSVRHELECRREGAKLINPVKFPPYTITCTLVFCLYNRPFREVCQELAFLLFRNLCRGTPKSRGCYRRVLARRCRRRKSDIRGWCGSSSPLRIGTGRFSYVSFYLPYDDYHCSQRYREAEQTDQA